MAATLRMRMPSHAVFPRPITRSRSVAVHSSANAPHSNLTNARAATKALQKPTASVLAAASPSAKDKCRPQLLAMTSKMLGSLVFMLMLGAVLMPAVGRMVSQHPDVLEVERLFLEQRTWARRMVAFNTQLLAIGPTAAPARGMVYTRKAAMEQLDNARYNYLLYGLLVLAHQGQVPGALPVMSDPVLQRAAALGQVTLGNACPIKVAVTNVPAQAFFWQAPEPNVSALKDSIRLEEIAVTQGTARLASLRQKHADLVKRVPICPTGKTMGTLIGSGQRIVQAEADVIRHGLILEQLQLGQTYIHDSAIDARVKQVMRRLHHAA